MAYADGGLDQFFVNLQKQKEEDIHKSWLMFTANKSGDRGKRLENASWRIWHQQRAELERIDRERFGIAQDIPDLFEEDLAKEELKHPLPPSITDALDLAPKPIPKLEREPDYRTDILIIGAGPTGLGAATRLNQLRHNNWMLIDQFSEAGGLACTDVTNEGFLFDMGGHVIFSHYKYFDDLIDDALGEGDVWNVMERVSYVWMRDRYVAYPFQNNIAALPIKDQEDCLSGLVEAKVANALAQSKPKNFDDWILRVMGEGIANIFMRPYNFKVWAIPTTQMQCEWLGERVATVDVKRAISNVLHKKEDAGWGPNATFRFPKTGGTGHIWKSVANLLPQNKLKFNCTVTNLNPDKKTVTLKDGKVIQYNKLLTTIPLDITLNWIGENELAEGLFYSTSNIIGLGIRGKHPHDKKCWLYYPEDNCPFYRTTVFSNYAEKNCPDASVKLKCICRGDLSVRPGDEVEKDGPYWSLMFEVSESSHKPVNHELIDIAGKKWSKIVQDTIQGAINVHLMDPDDEIVSIYHRRLEHGYPTPTVVRDGVLQEALPLLRQKDIWSRGRFGSYKYEVANQDHSCMIGVEAVDNMLFGTKELTLEYPNIVNPKKNMELLYYRVKEGEKASS